MPIAWTYRPPVVNAVVVLAAVKAEAEAAGAHVILSKSNENAPRDTGQMIDTAKVVSDAGGAVIVYPATSPEGYPYPVRQHEDMQLNHRHGGGPKFLEDAMHSEQEAAAAVMLGIIRRALL